MMTQETGENGRMHRRGLVAGTAGALAALLTRGSDQARAANGDPVLLGTDNTATNPTTVRNSSLGSAASTSGLKVVGGDGSSGVCGEPGGNGVVGQGGVGGTSGDPGCPAGGGSGVVGLGGNSAGALNDGTGVVGSSRGGAGVAGFSTSGIGVLAASQRAIALRAQAVGGAGVVASSDSNWGVYGTSKSSIGVVGQTTAGNNSPAMFAVGGGGVGLWAQSTGNYAIYGVGSAAPGVVGTSGAGVGVWGNSDNNYGVYATSQKSVGLYAQAPGFAGQFAGDVFISGSLTVASGAKSAAVEHPDGTLRRLYCVESPDSYFEDFGHAALRNGSAVVLLDPDFAALVQADSYDVFLSEYGDTGGLFVEKREARSFTVRARNPVGTGEFSYRVLARRKDVVGRRLEKVARPSESTAGLEPHGLPAPRPMPRSPAR